MTLLDDDIRTCSSFLRARRGLLPLFHHGDRCLDFTSGVGVLALGHVPRELLSVLREQGEKPWHVSNPFDVPEAERPARKLRRSPSARDARSDDCVCCKGSLFVQEVRRSLHTVLQRCAAGAIVQADADPHGARSVLDRRRVRVW